MGPRPLALATRPFRRGRLAAVRNLPILKDLGLACAGGNFDHCGLRAERCREHIAQTGARTFAGVGWLTCPVREVMADRHLVRVLDLRSQAKLAPISGWPQRYGAWAPQLLTLLEPPSVQPEAGEP